MAAVAPQPQHLGTHGQAHALSNGPSADKKASGNNGSSTQMETSSIDRVGNHAAQHNDANARAPAPAAKKGATKKAADPSETSKLLAAKISQLESDKAGEKDQEAEIGGLSVHARGNAPMWSSNQTIQMSPIPNRTADVEISRSMFAD